MKKLIIPFLIILLSSCNYTEVSDSYYQVFKTNTYSGMSTRNKIIFEDKNCSVSYNLWAEGGNIGFFIYNKTENYMTIDLTKTFFVLNGVAYEYYQNRTFSISQNNGTASTTTFHYYPYYWNLYLPTFSGTNSTNLSTSYSYIEKPKLTIPPKTSVNVLGYRITNEIYINSNLNLSNNYPSNWVLGYKKTVKFDDTNSPFVFYNLITYITKSDTTRIENKFYVSEITNYPSTETFTKDTATECISDYFYIKYK